jgi:predicted AlkP superfamily phosphohydrolase/phosphomutase
MLRIGYRWFSETGKIVSNGRLDFTKKVAPGEDLNLRTVLGAPMLSGNYKLAIGLLEENVSWIIKKSDNEISVQVKDSPREPVAAKPAGKIRLIGLDGATWDILLPWIQEGKLPNFSRLLRQAAWGPLQSLPGTLSPIMWTSIATGYERDTHGIEGFQVRDGYNMRLVRSEDRKVPALWNIASQFGLKSYIVNWMVTDPPEPINGIMVSRLHKIGNTGVYPPELCKPLDRVIESTDTSIPESKDKWRRYLHKELEQLIAVEKFLQDRDRPDFAAYYTHSTDEIQHRFWKFMEPELFSDPFWLLTPTSIEEHKDAIFNIYSRIDEWIGESWDQEEEILVLVSDHGQQAANLPCAYLEIDRLLELLGFLEFNDSGNPDHLSSKAFDCTENTWGYESEICINKSNTSKENSETQQIMVNRVKKDLAQALERLTLSDGTPLIRNVVIPRDQNSILINKTRLGSEQLDYTIKVENSTIPIRSILNIHDVSGEHTPNGIIAIAGGPTKPGYRILNASLLEVAPTILYLLGLPIAEDMRGRPMTEIIDPDYLAKNPVYHVRKYASSEKKPQLSTKDAEAEEELKDRLRSLGYIQ